MQFGNAIRDAAALLVDKYWLRYSFGQFTGNCILENQRVVEKLAYHLYIKELDSLVTLFCYKILHCRLTWTLREVIDVFN